MRELGETQFLVLRALREHGSWYPACGWIWDTYSGTKRVLDSLVKRGLVTTTTRKTKYYGEMTEYRPVKEANT